MRKERTPEEQRMAWDHVQYEIDMLRFCAERLVGADSTREHSEKGRNVLLESFAVHARVLVCFFFDQSGRSDDYLAGDFVRDEAAWLRARGQEPDSFKQIRDKVGKRIAHLTDGRLNDHPEAKGWDVGAIANAFGKLWDAILVNRGLLIEFPKFQTFPVSISVATGTAPEHAKVLESKGPR